MLDISTWKTDDKIICCRLLTEENAMAIMPGFCNILNCDSCKAPMLGAELTKSKQSHPGWHIICEDCFAELPANIEIKMKGKISRGQMEFSDDEAC
jgi:hypothetical protein